MKTVNVVIVDDEELVLNGQSEYISHLEGFNVVGKAANGLQAFNIIENSDVDIVITDIRMPQYDGIWLIEKLEHLNRDITVIIISAYDDKNYLLKAVKCPLVFDYLTKPYLDEELLETLDSARSYLTSRHSSDDINTTLITSGILNNEVAESQEYLQKYIMDDKLSFSDIKNRIYGWLVSCSMNPSLSGRINEERLNRMMRKVYETEDPDELYQLVSRFVSRLAEKEAVEDDVTVMVAAAIKTVNDSLADSELNLTSVADKLHVTPNYLSNRFSRDMGQSFSSYLLQTRIRRSKRLLRTVSYKIYEVAEMVGFADVSYFNKSFKKVEGITPMQYRMKKISQSAEEDNEEQ